MKEFIAVIDEIEATEGPGVVVTIGIGNRHFSTGYDMKIWLEDTASYFPSNELLGVLMDRLMRISLPSLCCFNGNAMAGGYFMGICHDFRTMTLRHGRVCLNELLFGGSLTVSLMAALTYKLSASSVHKLHVAKMISAQEALADGMIDNTYADEAVLMEQIKAFASRYAPIGKNRDAIRINKENQFKECLKVFRFAFFSLEQKYAFGDVNEALKGRIAPYLASLNKKKTQAKL